MSKETITKMLDPTPEQAEQFALMLGAGMPSTDIIRYFFESEKDQQTMHDRWTRSRPLKAAIRRQQHDRSWQQMTTDERIQHSVEKNYNEMAYFLYAHNYADLSGAERQKADICRQALEARIAGTAGKLDAITRFWDDIRTGRVQLAGS